VKHGGVVESWGWQFEKCHFPYVPLKGQCFTWNVEVYSIVGETCDPAFCGRWSVWLCSLWEPGDAD